MAKTITIETMAWLTAGAGPDVLKDGDSTSGIGFASHDMSTCMWSQVGKATITIEVPDEQVLIDNKVEALKAEKQRVIADAEVRCQWHRAANSKPAGHQLRSGVQK
jgi:hypothetical protein